MLFKIILIFFLTFECLVSIELNRDNLGQLCQCQFEIVDAINISNKNISSINANTFQNLSNLKSLRLDNNELSQINTLPFNDLTNLKLLNLSSNEMLSIEDKSLIFANLINLQYLYLNMNYMSEFTFEEVKNLINLKELWLEWNEMWSFDKNTLLSLTNLEKVCFYHNPISQKQPSLLKDICISSPKCVVYTSEACSY